MDYINNVSLFNIKIFKSKFIGLIILVFSIFLFNPIDSYAYTYVPEDIKITFYGVNGSTDYCEGLTQCFNFVPNKIASRVQVQTQKVSFTEGKQYKMYISLKLSVPTDYTIYDYYLSDYLVRNYAINVNKSDFKFLYWDDFGWFNVYQWDLELTVNPTFQGSGVSFDFYKSQATDQQIWILDVLDFHSELLADSSDTNVIIDNQNKNTQDIIDNQNKNTQEEIESQQVCKTYDFTKETLPVGVKDYFLNLQGGLYSSPTTYTSDFIEVSKDSYYYYSSNASSSTAYCLYDTSKTLIQCFSYQVGEHEIKPVQDGYIRLSWWNDWSTLNFRGKYCKNGNQALDDSINDLNDKLFDDDPLSESVIDDFFSGIRADFTTDTPISDLILMPFTLLESYSDGISSTCSSFSLGSLFGTDLSMPCIDLENILGSTFWTLIDMLFSVFMIYEISMLVISIFDSITSLDDSFQLLYSPRHGDMSRVGRGHSRGLY